VPRTESPPCSDLTGACGAITVVRADPVAVPGPLAGWRFELPAPVKDQEPAAAGALAKIHQEVPDLLRGPRPVPASDHAEDVGITTKVQGAAQPDCRLSPT